MRKTLGALLLALALPASAHAADSFTTFGPHLGFGSDPDQVFIGGQFVVGEVGPNIDLVPMVDIGFGDDATIISLNGDFRYRIDLAGYRWQPYVGAGVGFHFVSFDGNGPLEDGDDTFGGGHFIVGVDAPTRTGNRFFADLKLGIGDSPDLKIEAGWNFKIR
jgi:hypothetical protein